MRFAPDASALVVGFLLAAACTGEDSGSGEARRSPGAFEVSTTRRADLVAIGSDTLSEAARFLSLLPEADGEAIVFTFSDSVRGVTSGLGIVDRQSPSPQLLWPDSVTRAWWVGPHSVAFATHTGDGVRVVVDVHAGELEVATRGADSGTTGTPVTTAGDTVEARARATRYVDSLRLQPAGRAERSQLHYQVTTLRPAPRRAWAAFYVVARDSSGSRSNPGWYFLDYQSGQVLPIDEVTGPVTELPETTAAWSEDGRFVYVKGRQIHEARISEHQRP